MADENDVNAQPVFDELSYVANGRDITRGYIVDGPIYPTDRVLQARGGDYTFYEQTYSDDQIKATFEQRRLAVTRCEWEVEPGGPGAAEKDAASFISETLDRIEFDRATDKMLHGIFYGYAVAECMWARDGNRIVLDRIKVRNRRRFVYDNEMRLRLITQERPQGEIMPPRKFWEFQTGQDNDDDPYGLGLAHWLYWPVFFKRNNMKFWLTALEKWGAPTTVGKVPAGASEAEKRKLTQTLMAFANSTAITVPEGVTVDLLEATRTGTADYATLHDRMNAAIAKVVVGQTMTTDDGSSQSQANVHMDVRQDIVTADADLICASLNAGPIRWLTEWNYGPDVIPPRVWRVTESQPDLSAMATRDKTVYDMGFKPTLQYIQDTYGGEWAERSTAPANPFLRGGGGNDTIGGGYGDDSDGGDGSAFAERGARREDAIDRLSTRAVTEDGWVKLMKPAVDPIREALANADSLAAVREQLDRIEPDTGALTQKLAESMFVARVAGETEADITDAPAE